MLKHDDDVLNFLFDDDDNLNNKSFREDIDRRLYVLCMHDDNIVL